MAALYPPHADLSLPVELLKRMRLAQSRLPGVIANRDGCSTPVQDKTGFFC
jgi:hypothetical protein